MNDFADKFCFQIRGAKALDIPVVVTEQYPERLGSTVSELQQVLPPDALIQSKLEFSMLGGPAQLVKIAISLST